MKHFYTIELGQAKKHLRKDNWLFIEAFRLAFAPRIGGYL